MKIALLIIVFALYNVYYCKSTFISSNQEESSNLISNLKIVTPNGGESLNAGINTVIKWEGVPSSDTVLIEYSTDSGESWNEITHKATGLNYNWSDLPNVKSNNCLIRASRRKDGKTLRDNPTLVWSKNYGGSNSDFAKAIVVAKDGNYIIAGSSSSNDYDVKQSSGLNSTWVIKVNSKNGEIIWQKNFGGALDDYINSMIVSKNGDIVFVGFTKTPRGDKEGGAKLGFADYWILKFKHENGDVIWQKSYGGEWADGAKSIVETNQGSYIIVGNTNSSEGDIDDNSKNSNLWLINIDSDSGKLIWKKKLPFIIHDFDKTNHSLILTKDEKIIVAGSSVNENNGNSKNLDVNILKVNPADGMIIWQKFYGGKYNETTNSAIQTKDNNLILVGKVSSSDGDVKSKRFGDEDLWVVKINSNNGSLIWEKCFGQKGADEGYSVTETKDGNLAIVGRMQLPLGGTYIGSFTYDAWLLKINQDNGDELWSAGYGGEYQDKPQQVFETNDNHLIVIGWTNSVDGDVINNYGYDDYWLLKIKQREMPFEFDISDNTFSITDTTTSIIEKDEFHHLFNYSFYPNPANDFVTFNGDFISYEFINVLGEVILRGNQKTIDVSQLEKGVYFLQIHFNNDKYKIEKFIK